MRVRSLLRGVTSRSTFGHDEMIIAPSSSRSSNVYSPDAARRWVRDYDETCVSKVFRVSDILPNYVVHYRFEDKQWLPLLQEQAGNPTSLEVRARHINWELRYLAQYNHPQFVTLQTQHSVYHPRGIVLRSYVECNHGRMKQMLVSKIRHEGYLDARLGENSPRGIIGVSIVTNFGTGYARSRDLVERSRRAGATAALMSALDTSFVAMNEVGKKNPVDVFLLRDNMARVGAGVKAQCMVASCNIARHAYHYTHRFETPIQCCLDACIQGAYHTALLDNKLVQKDEGLHAIAWEVMSYYPYLPIEVDLPFEIVLSKPTIYGKDDTYPSTTIGYPVLAGSPVQHYHATIQQGNPQYVSHESETASERAFHWWRQRKSSPYQISLFLVRTSMLDFLQSVDFTHTNPFTLDEVRTMDSIPKDKLRRLTQKRIADGLEEEDYQPGAERMEDLSSTIDSYSYPAIEENRP